MIDLVIIIAILNCVALAIVLSNCDDFNCYLDTLWSGSFGCVLLLLFGVDGEIVSLMPDERTGRQRLNLSASCLCDLTRLSSDSILNGLARTGAT